MVTAARPDDRPGGKGEAAPQPHLVMSLFLADRGQLEGALGLANRDIPLTPGRTLMLPDKTTRQIADGGTFGTLGGAPGSSGPAPDADVFAVAWLNRAEKGLLAGSATAPLTVRAPEGFVPADGVGVVVRDDQQSLTDLAAAFLSPFEQLAREALLWAVESVTAGLQADDTPGPDDVVTASSLHAVYLDLVDPTRPLTPEAIAGFFAARRVGLEIAPMPASAPNPSYTVFPMPPFLTMTVPGRPAVDFGSQPYLVHLRVRPGRRGVRPGPRRSGPAPAGTGRPGAGHAGPKVPPTHHVRRRAALADWFTFLVRQVVQDALDVFRSVEHRPGPGAEPADARSLRAADPDLMALTTNKANPAFPGGPFRAGAALTYRGRVVPCSRRTLAASPPGSS